MSELAELNDVRSELFFINGLDGVRSQLLFIDESDDRSELLFGDELDDDHSLKVGGRFDFSASMAIGPEVSRSGPEASRSRLAANWSRLAVRCSGRKVNCSGLGFRIRFKCWRCSEAVGELGHCGFITLDCGLILFTDALHSGLAFFRTRLPFAYLGIV